MPHPLYKWNALSCIVQTLIIKITITKAGTINFNQTRNVTTTKADSFSGTITACKCNIATTELILQLKLKLKTLHQKLNCN